MVILSLNQFNLNVEKYIDSTGVSFQLAKKVSLCSVTQLIPCKLSAWSNDKCGQ